MLRHRVSSDTIQRLFAGTIDADAIAEIRDGQYSKRLLLLKAVWDRTIGTADASKWERSWSLLTAAQQRRPDVVRDVLMYPAVGAWLLHTVRRARGLVHDDVPISMDLSHFGSIVAAAAMRCQLPATITVPVWHDAVVLPTIGIFRTPGGQRAASGELRISGADTDVQVEPDGPWLALDDLIALSLRKHRCEAGGLSIEWTIDDIDPYRESDSVKPPTRLGDHEFTRWCGLLDDAWAILVDRHADYARELAAVNPVLIPLASSGGIVASSSVAAFGAIMLAGPKSAVTLAETVVHELQHSKLNAILDLLRLRHDGVERLCYAPWRPDPRPLTGLLHGIYAFTSVTEFWSRERHSTTGQARKVADFTLAYYLRQVRQAVRSIVDDPELTELGTSFVAAADARLSACSAENVPDDVLALVEARATAQRIAWRLRHMAPAWDDVEVLTQRWIAGEPPPDKVLDNSRLSPEHRAGTRPGLSDLLKLKAFEPTRFAELGAQLESAGSAGDFACAAGEYNRAISAYAERIRVDPDDDSAWVGLMLCLDAGGVTGELPPEVVAATGRRIAEIAGIAPDPVALASWLAGRTGRARPG